MRDFFKSELKSLKIKRGLNQWENISAMDEPEEKFKMLFDLMEQVCEEFPYIPEDEKKRIIQYGILHEPEMMQLTPHLVWKWLNSNSNKYYNVTKFNGKTEEESRASNARPVTYDELSPETREQVNAFIQALSESKKVPPLSQEQIQSEGQEKGIKKATAGHIPTKAEIQVERRLEAIKKLGYDKLSPKEVADMQIFKVGEHDIRARNQEEAEQIALEIYAD